jgi:hypothetical protein
LQGADILFNGRPELSAVDSLISMMRTWLAELPAAAPLLLALSAEAQIDDEARDALRVRMSALRDVIETVYINRIKAEGFLREDADPREISDFVLMLGSPPMWQQLTQFLGWDHAHYSNFVIAHVLKIVVKPSP